MPTAGPLDMVAGRRKKSPWFEKRFKHLKNVYQVNATRYDHSANYAQNLAPETALVRNNHAGRSEQAWRAAVRLPSEPQSPPQTEARTCQEGLRHT